MSDRSEETPEIKIIDRRSFTSDGQRRSPDQESEAGERPEPAAAPPSASKPAPEAPAAHGEGFTMHGPPPEPHEGAPGEAETAFLNLCVSLYQSGAIHLGLGPDGQPSDAPADLEAAQGVIEILAMLKRKTKGNLSKEEGKILDSLVAELQMAWVMKRQGA